MEQHCGDREASGTPTTPTTPLTTPTTPLFAPIAADNSGPPSPMTMNRLKSSQSRSVSGSPIATQPPPETPRKEHAKHDRQATSKEVFSTETLATSQVKQQAHVPSSKHDTQPLSKEMHVLSPGSTRNSQKALPQPNITSSTSSARQVSLASTTTSIIITKAATTEHASVATSSGISTSSLNVSTQQQAAPTKVSQTSVKSSTTVLSISSSDPTRSRNASVTNTVTTQAQVDKQRVSHTLSAASLTRSPLRHRKTASSVSDTQSLTKQPQRLTQAQSSRLASSVTNALARNIQQSTSANDTGRTQPQNASTSQPLGQQTQPVMSPIVSQTQPSSSLPSTSVGQVGNKQQFKSASSVQALNALPAQASLNQQIPVMVGLEYPPTLEQLQTLAKMGVQIPMYNLPQLVLQDPNQQLSAGTACSQAAILGASIKQHDPHKVGVPGGTNTIVRPTLQQNTVTAAKSGVNSTLSVSGNSTPTTSKTATPMKSGGRAASKQAARPMHYNSTPVTSAHGNTFHNVPSSPKSTMSAKKLLNFSGSASTTLNSNHGNIQATQSTSSRVVQNSSLKENSASTSAAGGGQKVKANALPSLLCTICQRTPWNPLRSECCGTLYCEPCSRKVERCPQHNKRPLRFKRDAELFNVIQKQETKCKYAGNGCTWIGKVAEQKQHIMMCIYNPSSELHCMLSLKFNKVSTNLDSYIGDI